MAMLTLAFELKDGIHDMLKSFRPGKCAFLRNMAYQEDGSCQMLGHGQKLTGDLADLGPLVGGSGRRDKAAKLDLDMS